MKAEMPQLDSCFRIMRVSDVKQQIGNMKNVSTALEDTREE